MTKRLYKSNNNRVISGVCGGLGEYFGIDPTIVRLLWIIFSFAGGSGIIAYIVAAIIIPTGSNESTHPTPPNHYDPNSN